MFKTLGHTAVAAWICAALFASPILTAMECRRCCSQASPDRAATSCHANAKDQASLPACCRHHTTAKPLEQRDQCPACPKCEAKRPSPAVTGGNTGWKLPVLMAFTVPSHASEVLAGLGTCWEGGREIIDRATPPPRVLFCTWRE